MDAADLDPDPVLQVGRWVDDAAAAGVPEPTAMTVATVDPGGRPDARVVLLRRSTARGLVFFTNRDSAKGRQLAVHPWAAAVLCWPSMARQVRARGPVLPLDEDDSDAYWATRPRGSQVGAWASAQSQPISSRQVLVDEVAAVEGRFAGGPVPRPPWWGGYELVCETVELWHGQPDRLHDRLRYRRDDAGAWVVERLSP